MKGEEILKSFDDEEIAFWKLIEKESLTSGQIYLIALKKFEF